MRKRADIRNFGYTIIFAVMFITVYFYSFIEYNYRIILLLAGVAVCIAVTVVSRDWIIQITLPKVLWLASLTVALIGLNRCLVQNRFQQIYFLFIALLIVLYKSNDVSVLIIYHKLVYIMGIMFSVFTVFPLMFRDVYVSKIVPLMIVNGSFDITNYMNRGMYAGFTNQTGINAVYLSFGIGASFLYLLFSKTKIEKVKSIVLVGFEVICLLLTSKRGALLYSVVTLLIIYYLNSSRGRKITNAVKIVCLIMGLFLFAYYFVPAANVVFTRFLEGSESTDISNGRFKLYEAALEYFQANKLIGIGWTNFRYKYRIFMDVHNVYLQLLCETGIIGAIPFYIAFVVSIVSTIKKINQLKPVGGIVYQSVLFSAYIQIFFLLHCLTSNALYDYYISFFYFSSVIICSNLRIQEMNDR